MENYQNTQLENFRRRLQRNVEGILGNELSPWLFDETNADMRTYEQIELDRQIRTSTRRLAEQALDTANLISIIDEHQRDLPMHEREQNRVRAYQMLSQTLSEPISLNGIDDRINTLNSIQATYLFSANESTGYNNFSGVSYMMSNGV